ncbi:MarR family winged helix-turn-helix transcriptional regulator, partial [Acinetobacter baumannii]
MLPVNQPLGIDQCNCFAVRKASRQISRLYDSHLEPSGLRIPQFLTLAALDEVGSTPVNALAERLDIERTAMGKMVGFL